MQASVKKGPPGDDCHAADGSILGGVLLCKSEKKLLLRDTAKRKHRIPASQVQPRSMPARECCGVNRRCACRSAWNGRSRGNLDA